MKSRIKRKLRKNKKCRTRKRRVIIPVKSGGDARDEIELIRMRINTIEFKIETLKKELETKNVMLNRAQDEKFKHQLNGKIVDINYNIVMYKAEILKLKDEISRLETVELPKSESVDSPNIVKSTPINKCEGIELDYSTLRIKKIATEAQNVI